MEKGKKKPKTPERDPDDAAPTSDPKPRYEHGDAKVGGIAKLAVVLAVITAAAMGVTYVLAGSLSREEQAGHTAPPPIAAGRPVAPPEPRLSPSPPKTLEELRAEENAALESYGWEDAERGVVRIPLDRAIDLLAERGLPARKPRPAEAPISRPTQSTLGEPRAKGEDHGAAHPGGEK